MIWLPLLAMLALPAEAAAPSDDASAPPADAALTSTEVDAKRVMEARALLADDTSRHEAVALLARLAVHGDPAVATEARRAMLRVLLASPAKPGWRELYGRVNDVATAEERATLAARARALPRTHTRPPRRVRPMATPHGRMATIASPRAIWPVPAHRSPWRSWPRRTTPPGWTRGGAPTPVSTASWPGCGSRSRARPRHRRAMLCWTCSCAP